MTQGKEKNLKHISHAIINKSKKYEENDMFQINNNNIKIDKVQFVLIILIVLNIIGYFYSKEQEKTKTAEHVKEETVEQENSVPNTSAEYRENQEINESDEKNQNLETTLNDKPEPAENQADKAAVNNGKYIFLPYKYIMYNNKGDITNKSSYFWEDYITPFDYKVSYKISQPQNIYIEVSMERKNNIGKVNHKTYINNILDKDLSYTNNIEFYDNSSVILKLEKIKWNGEKVPNSLSVKRNQQLGIVRLIEVLDKSFNLLKRYDILNNGTRTERNYINYDIQSLTAYEDYYYENVLITSLYHTEHYTNNKLIYITELKVDNVEEIDENTVKIKMVQETVKDNKRIIDYKSEYILSKYMVEKDGKLTFVDKVY